jgi:hypothetical protein
MSTLLRRPLPVPPTLVRADRLLARPFVAFAGATTVGGAAATTIAAGTVGHAVTLGGTVVLTAHASTWTHIVAFSVALGWLVVQDRYEHLGSRFRNTISVWTGSFDTWEPVRAAAVAVLSALITSALASLALVFLASSPSTAGALGLLAMGGIAHQAGRVARRRLRELSDGEAASALHVEGGHRFAGRDEDAVAQLEGRDRTQEPSGST